MGLTKQIVDAEADIQARAYRDGLTDGIEIGIEAYAWWKDGVQYVGTTGRTLKEALADKSYP